MGKVLVLIFFIWIFLNTGNGNKLFCPSSWNVQPLCTVISVSHNFLNTIVPPWLSAATLQHCRFLEATPHCCEQFCTPAVNGTCETSTGVCRCEGSGTPSTCEMYFNANNPRTNPKVLKYCAEKCNAGGGSEPGSCVTPAYVNDGINYICVCYCT